MNAQPGINGHEPGVKGDVMGRARSQAVSGSRRSVGELTFHGLMSPASGIRSRERHWAQPAEDAPAAAVG